MHNVRDYASGLRNGKFLGYRCRSCGHEWLTSVEICPFCGSIEIEDKEFPKNGKILAYTVQHVVPEELQQKAPFVIAVIELENGAKLQARIENYRPELGNLIGRNVRMSGGSESGLLFDLN
jgi:hypothetical protein